MAGPWDPFGVWDSMAQAAPGSRALAALLRKQLLGRRFTVRTKAAEVTLTLSDVDVPFDSRAMSAGQLDDVRVTATDVEWKDVRVDRVTARLHNVHTRLGAAPVLVAAPVDLAFRVSLETIFEAIARHRPGIRLELVAGVPVVRWAKHPGWGFLEIEIGVQGTSLVVSPRLLVLHKLRLHRVRRLPPWSIKLPVPGDDLRFTGLRIEPDGVDLDARLDQVRLPLSGRPPA